jgi:hypothetical protein
MARLLAELSHQNGPVLAKKRTANFAGTVGQPTGAFPFMAEAILRLRKLAVGGHNRVFGPLLKRRLVFLKPTQNGCSVTKYFIRSIRPLLAPSAGQAGDGCELAVGARMKRWRQVCTTVPIYIADSHDLMWPFRHHALARANAAGFPSTTRENCERPRL